MGSLSTHRDLDLSRRGTGMGPFTSCCTITFILDDDVGAIGKSCTSGGLYDCVAVLGECIDRPPKLSCTFLRFFVPPVPVSAPPVPCSQRFTSMIVDTLVSFFATPSLSGKTVGRRTIVFSFKKTFRSPPSGCDKAVCRLLAYNNRRPVADC